MASGAGQDRAWGDRGFKVQTTVEDRGLLTARSILVTATCSEARLFLCCYAAPLMQLWGLGIEFDASHPSLVVPFLRAAAMVCPAKACQHEVPLILRAGDKAASWRILSTVGWSVRILLLCRHGMLMLRTCQDI